VNASDWIAAGAALATLLLAGAAFLSLRQGRDIAKATKEQADATAREAAATAREAEATHEQAEATREQAELAARALGLQVEPRLIPVAGTVEVRERESVGGDVQILWVVPVRLELANAGNGVAILETVSAQGPGLPEARALFPPALRGGDSGTVELLFSRIQELKPGDVLRILVVYRGADGERRRLEFDADFLGRERWELRLTNPLPSGD
jgi:hypothetical protein